MVQPKMLHINIKIKEHNQSFCKNKANYTYFKETVNPFIPL